MNLKEVAQRISNTLNREPSPSKPMFNQLITFFTNDDWSFTRLQDEPVLYIG